MEVAVLDNVYEQVHAFAMHAPLTSIYVDSPVLHRVLLASASPILNPDCDTKCPIHGPTLPDLHCIRLEQNASSDL